MDDTSTDRTQRDTPPSGSADTPLPPATSPAINPAGEVTAGGAPFAAGPAAIVPPATAEPVSAPEPLPSTTASGAGLAPQDRTPDQIEAGVLEALRTCYDPEIPVNIYDLGLIYSVQVEPNGFVAIRMTLTSPMCPVAGSLPPEVEAKVRNVVGVTDAKVDVVWDPPWGPSMMSEAAKLQLNI